MEYLAQGGPFYDRSNTLEAVAASGEYNKKRIHDPSIEDERSPTFEDVDRSKRMKKDEGQTT